MSEILVGSITEASDSIGLSPFFVGVIVVAIVGNAAEHWVAIYFASRDKMDLAVNIAIGSSAQIALFAAPVLVLLSFFIGPFPMALVFNGLELGAIFMAILIANQVTQEGESTWFEGLQLLAVYVVLGTRLLLRLDDVRLHHRAWALAGPGGGHDRAARGRPQAVRARPRADVPRGRVVVDRLARRGAARGARSCGCSPAARTRSPTRRSTSSSARCRSTTCSSSSCSSRTSGCRRSTARTCCSGASSRRSRCAAWRSSAASR